MALQHTRSKRSLSSMLTQKDSRSLTELRLSAEWSPMTVRRRRQTDTDKNRTECIGFKAGRSCTGTVALRAAPDPRRRVPRGSWTKWTSRLAGTRKWFNLSTMLLTRSLMRQKITGRDKLEWRIWNSIGCRWPMKLTEPQTEISVRPEVRDMQTKTWLMELVISVSSDQQKSRFNL